MARDFDRQVAEAQIRSAVLNGYTALGIPRTVTVDKSVRGKGLLDHGPFCTTKPLSVPQFAFCILI